MAVAKNLSPPPPPRSRFSFQDFLLLSIDDNETREERINIFIEKAESSILDSLLLLPKYRQRGFQERVNFTSMNRIVYFASKFLGNGR